MYKVVDLFFDRSHEFIICLEVTRITSLDRYLFSSQTALTIVHNHVYDTTHADFSDVSIRL